MDNLNFDWPLGFEMKSLVEGRGHHLGPISQIARFVDTSDEITGMTVIWNMLYGRSKSLNIWQPQDLACHCHLAGFSIFEFSVKVPILIARLTLHLKTRGLYAT
jgi:hypothetical protein